MGNNKVTTEMDIAPIVTETTEKFWDAETAHNKTADTNGTEHVKSFFAEAWLQANNIHNVRTAYAKHVKKQPSDIRQLPAYLRGPLGLIVEDGENDKKLTNRGLRLLEICISEGTQKVEDTKLYKYVAFRQSEKKRMPDRFSQLVNQYDVHLSQLAKAEAEAQQAEAKAEANGKTETETETENSIIPIDNRIEATLKFLKDYSDDDIVKFLHTIANEHRTILKADLAKAQAEAEAEQKKLQEKAEADKKAKAEAEKKFRKETAKQIQNPKNRKKPYVARDQKNTEGLQASA